MAFEGVGPRVRGLGGQQGVDHFHGGDQERRVAGWAGGVAQGEGQMRFAQAATAHEDHVGVGFQERQAEAVPHLGAVDFLGPAPVELAEGLEHGKAGGGDGALHQPILLPQGFAFHEPAQILHRAPLF